MVFSYFQTRLLTVDEENRWEEFPVVFLTPDSDQWDPQSSHYADAEAAMVDHTGELVNCEKVVQHVFDASDVSELYAETATWELFEQVADDIVLDSDLNLYVNNTAMDDNDGDDEDAR